MGSFAYVDKELSAIKTASFATEAVTLDEIPKSPKKETPVAAAAAIVGFPMRPRRSFASTNRSFGSKDETFYDSQLWLESDCEDDFYSVGGDFTPSRGNTPKQSFGGRTPRATNFMYEDKVPNLMFIRTPTQRRKKLFELFRDSIREEELEETGEQEAHESNVTTTHSLSDSSRNENVETRKEKLFRPGRGCFPGLFSCGGFLEKKKKIRSAAMAVKG